MRTRLGTDRRSLCRRLVTQEPPRRCLKFNWRLIFTEGIRCQQLPGISFPSTMKENNILLYVSTTIVYMVWKRWCSRRKLGVAMNRSWKPGGQKQQKSTTHSETFLQLSTENYWNIQNLNKMFKQSKGISTK